MVPWRINDEKGECPSCWDETTVGQYQRIKAVPLTENGAPKKEIQILLEYFSALIDQRFDVVAQSNSEELEVALYQAGAFIFNERESFRDKPAPKHISIPGIGSCDLPTKLGKLTIEQNLLIRGEMEEKKVLEQMIAFTAAVYLQPLLEKDDFSLDSARIIEKKLLEMRIVDIWPISFFFLSKLYNFGSNGLLYSLLRKLMSLLWMRKLPKLRASKGYHPLVT